VNKGAYKDAVFVGLGPCQAIVPTWKQFLSS